ncbi:MAG: hypothetical protein DCC71_00615 [Proteobacteria bacterium]|nr:MAG: hypothetical protein DCC71_00615 [Pseudomonadota bacterium]
MDRALAWPASLPPDDRERAPYTGFARAHWEHVADALLAGVRRFASPRGALLALPGGPTSMNGARSDGLEGFARTFLLAAFRLRGADGRAPGDLAARCADGLAAGTEPGHDESWPAITPTSQPMVEAASIALALFETRPWIWDALPDAVRQRTVAWLSTSFTGPAHPNNWLLFPVVVDAFLASVGAPHRPDLAERNLALVDAMYRRDGWYSDGPGRHYDHYVGWAIHFYTVWWLRMGGAARDPARAARTRARIRRFLEDFEHLFAADGAPLHQGRSLIYRFAAAAPLWAGAIAGATPLAPGATRRIASGALRHFLAHGAIEDGLLTMGWHRAFPAMAQRYSGPASPYWASKGFAGLVLPSAHPVWTDVEAPLAVERGDFCRALSEPGWLVRGTRADGVVRVANHGSDHFPAIPLGASAAHGDDPFYRKLGYATHAGPCLGAEADAADCDAQVSLLDEAGVASRRARIHPIACADRFAASCFFPGERHVIGTQPFPLWLERVETVSIARGALEVRIHHAMAYRPRRLRDGGYALAGDAAPAVERGPGWCAVRRADGLVSAVVGLHGFGAADAVRFEDANAFGRLAAAPFLLGADLVGPEAVYVSLHAFGAQPFEPDALRAEVRALRVRGRLVELAFADGERCLVQLVAADAIDVALGGVRVAGAVRFARLAADGALFVRLDG